MKNLDLTAQKRKPEGKKSNKLRNSGFIPAIVYGHGMENLPIVLTEKDFLKTVGTSAGTNAIINLKVGSDAIPVITHNFQKDILTGRFMHVDFMKIRMDEAIKAKVHVELKGVPTGVKDDGGILVQTIREIEIKCLPNKIPEKFELDVTALKVGDSLHVSDVIDLFKDIEFLTPANEPVASVSAPMKEEEAAPAEVAAVPVEGAAPAEGAPAGTATAAPAVPAKEAEKPAKETKPAKEAKK